MNQPIAVRPSRVCRCSSRIAVLQKVIFCVSVILNASAVILKEPSQRAGAILCTGSKTPQGLPSQFRCSGRCCRTRSTRKSTTSDANDAEGNGVKVNGKKFFDFVVGRPAPHNMQC